MYENLIKNYVNILTINDILNYSKKENISITNKEAEVILFYIKKYWQIIYKGNPNSIFNELKSNVSQNTYNKIIELYNRYKSYSL